MATIVKTCVRPAFSKFNFRPKDAFIRYSRSFSNQIEHNPRNSTMFNYPLFRCDVNKPQDLSRTNEAQFYRMDNEIAERLFKLGGFPKQFARQNTTFGETCFMVRNPALEVIDCIKSANYDDPVVKYVMYGAEGAGKSISLAHIIHFCDNAEWILVHVPWAPQWTKNVREITPSINFKDKRDLPVMAALWLQHFKLQNAEKLLKLDIRTSRTYSWSKREETPAGQPLLDIIEQGTNRMKYSIDCVIAILEEIKHHASTGTFKALVAIDGVNTFYDITTLRKEQRVIMQPDEITLVTAFKNLILSKWNNGAVVVTVDKIAGSDRKESYLPKYLLAKEGFAAFEPFIPIHVPLYSRKEISSCLDYYIDRNWIQMDIGRTDAGKSELVFLSGYNPYSLMRICAAW